ncbi:MAG: dihydroneopterin aldolase [Candidatus Planktophila sp.]|nr:dihydroneopterin aldolase [Candidatus Planktophila sp.]
MSDQILLEGIHGFGYHGLLEHERTNGQDFYVDLTLDVDLRAASLSDSIDDTVNYAEITDLVVAAITTNPVSLIEKLAGRIAEQILTAHPKVNAVTVTVHKPQAPVAASFKDIAVQITRTR